MLEVVLVINALVAAGVAARVWGRRRHVRPGDLHPTPLWSSLTEEIERARRYEHSFTLIRIRQEVGPPDMADAVARELGLPLRRTDRCWYVGGAFFILLPEATVRESQGWERRLRDSSHLGDAEVCVANFPDDGLTCAGLLERLDSVTRDRADHLNEAPRRAS
jgi:hypothetical protein